MRPKLIAILVANLFVVASYSFAANSGLTWSGAVSLGLRHVSDTATDPSKLNEYRDLGSTAPITAFDVRGRGDDYYFNAFGENLGRDDQFIDLWGGKYGVFKYQLYTNELRHNFGSGPGALSPYSGIGGSTLTAIFPPPATAPAIDLSTWKSFDHSYKRRDLGGMFEFSGNSPWYIRAEANEVTRKGINVFAGAQGTSPGNGFVDLPAPIDYTARNYSLEGGYSSKQGHFAVNVMHSKFSNDNDLLMWSNGFFGGVDKTILPPDNELTKVSANGNLRQLPWSSTLAGRITYSKLTNDVPVQATMLSTGGTNPATAPNSPLFHGEIVNKTASASLTSHPTRELDTRLYWNWLRKDNNSTAMEFTPAQGSGLLAGGGTTTSNCTNGSAVAPVVPARPCEPERFNYKKNNLGVEAGYRLNPQNKFSAGFDYWDMERERIDFIKNIDRKYYVEWKNNSLDELSARLKYQYLERRSTFQSSDPTNPIDAFVRRFDLANVNQNLLKVVLDATPMQFVDLGLEAIYKKNDYKDTILGRTDDERQEYYASLSYGDPKNFRVMVFGDVEFIEYNSVHRVGVGNPDPSTAPSPLPPAAATTYNWAGKNKDKSWQVGIGADWLPLERVTLKSSLVYAETHGTVDFSALASGGVTPVVDPRTLLPIGNFDNTRRTAFNLKGIYKYSKQWEFTGGYAFERYRYSDIGYDGMRYIAPASAASLSNNSNGYVTGQFAFQPYTANIFYVIATYKF